MPRVKKGKLRAQKRNKVLRNTKGYKWRRKNVYKLAKEARMHALSNQYTSRRLKKRDMRRLWQLKINAAARQNNTTYSKLTNNLKNNKVELDRKTLADLAENEPDTFQQLVEKVSKK